MNKEDNRLSYIRVNDIFDELIDENKRLKQCLNVLFRFKSFVDLISNKLKTNFDSNDWQKFEDLNKEVEEVFKRNQINGLNEPQIKSENLPLNPKLPKFCDTKSLESRSEAITDNSKDSSKCLFKRTRRPIPPPVDGLYVCDYIGCGISFKNRKLFSNHRSVHTKPVQIRKGVKKGKKFFCEVNGCDYSTPNKSQLMFHGNVHKGIRPFKCQKCDKSYHSNKTLLSHISLLHKTSDQIFVCKINNCNKEFTNRGRYRMHKTNGHLSERLFHCQYEGCNYKGLLRGALNAHIKVVHSPERPFHCDIEGCNKTFKTKQNLVVHLRGHTDERNFICDFPDCKKSFRTEIHLRKHSLGCHLLSKVKCDWPGCEYSSRNRRCLKTHQLIHSSERNFPCNWPGCSKRFKTKNHLDTHSRIHTQDKKHLCVWPGCQYRCTDYSNLVKHRKQVHKM